MQQNPIKATEYYIKVNSADGNGIIGIATVNPSTAGYQATNFQKLKNGTMPGEALFTPERPGVYSMVLTPSYVDMGGANSALSKTIDKSIMKTFWENVNKLMRPGSYATGDASGYPLGNKLIEAFKNRKLYNTSIFIDSPSNINLGLTPDSYSSIIRQGLRPGNRLRWGEGFTKWNDSAVTNKRIYDAAQDLKNGLITPEEYENIFNTWVGPIGGRPLQWMVKGNKKIPIHPHPFIYKEQKGGKL